MIALLESFMSQFQDDYLPTATGRHYEQRWVQGWYRNMIYPGTYFYVLSKQ